MFIYVMLSYENENIYNDETIILIIIISTSGVGGGHSRSSSSRPACHDYYTLL